MVVYYYCAFKGAELPILHYKFNGGLFGDFWMTVFVMPTIIGITTALLTNNRLIEYLLGEAANEHGNRHSRLLNAFGSLWEVSGALGFLCSAVAIVTGATQFYFFS